jgi:hypothetical protein
MTAFLEMAGAVPFPPTGAFPRATSGLTMGLKPHRKWFLLFFAYFSLVAIPAAHAYIDPGTGSYVIQIIIGGILGALVAVKVFWGRFWAFISRRNRRSKAAPGPKE